MCARLKCHKTDDKNPTLDYARCCNTVHNEYECVVSDETVKNKKQITFLKKTLLSVTPNEKSRYGRRS